MSGVPDYWKSFENFMVQGGDCDDIAIAYATLLQDNGYLPYVMVYGGPNT